MGVQDIVTGSGSNYDRSESEEETDEETEEEPVGGEKAYSKREETEEETGLPDVTIYDEKVKSI